MKSVTTFFAEGIALAHVMASMFYVWGHSDYTRGTFFLAFALLTLYLADRVESKP